MNIILLLFRYNTNIIFTKGAKMSRINFKTMLITHNGRTQTLFKWLEELDLNYNTVTMRYRNGNTIEQMLAPTHTGFNGATTTSPTSLLGAPQHVIDILGVKLAVALCASAKDFSTTPNDMIKYIVAQWEQGKTEGNV